jgi:hypothetical protein
LFSQLALTDDHEPKIGVRASRNGKRPDQKLLALLVDQRTDVDHDGLCEDIVDVCRQSLAGHRENPVNIV